MTCGRIRIALAAAVGLWAAAAVGGVGLLMASTRIPDAAAATVPRWPAGLVVPRQTGRPTLVICLHPRCPCSDATLDALGGLVDRADVTRAMNVVVLFAVPDPARPAWTETGLVARARRMPGVTVVVDSGGRSCVALDARSSGQTFFYDAADRLVFAGGLTPGRGESGETAGRMQIARFLAGDAPPALPLRTHVFGCALYRKAIAEVIQ